MDIPVTPLLQPSPVISRMRRALLIAALAAMPMGLIEECLTPRRCSCSSPQARVAVYVQGEGFTLGPRGGSDDAAGELAWWDRGYDSGGWFFSTRRTTIRRLDFQVWLPETDAPPDKSQQLALRRLLANYVADVERRPEVAQRIMSPDMHRDRVRWLAVLANGAVVTIPGALLLASLAGTRRTASPGECASCGYCLAGLQTTICPECGTAFDPAHLKAEVPENPAAPPS